MPIEYEHQPFVYWLLIYMEGYHFLIPILFRVPFNQKPTAWEEHPNTPWGILSETALFENRVYPKIAIDWNNESMSDRLA